MINRFSTNDGALESLIQEIPNTGGQSNAKSFNLSFGTDCSACSSDRTGGFRIFKQINFDLSIVNAFIVMETQWCLMIFEIGKVIL